MNAVIAQALSESDRCLYPGCQKPLGPGEGIRHGGGGQRYCDDYCFESFRCWINTEMMLCHWLVEAFEALRRTYG